MSERVCTSADLCATITTALNNLGYTGMTVNLLTIDNHMWKWYGIKPFSREGENCIVTEDEGTVEVTSSVFDSDYQPLGIFKLQFLVKICFDGIVGDNLNYVNVSIVLRHNGVDIDELNALSGSVDLGEYVLTQVTPNATDNNYMEIAGRLNKF